MRLYGYGYVNYFVLDKINRWFAREESSGRSPGCCERCGEYGIICLNGDQFLCWKHYCEEMQVKNGRAP